MEDKDFSRIQGVLNTINNMKNNEGDIANQLRVQFVFLPLDKGSLTNEEEKEILNAIVNANIKFNSELLELFFYYSGKESVDLDLIKQILNIIENAAEFLYSSFEYFVDACKKSSLDTDCIKNIFKIMNAKIVFKGCGAGSLLEKFLNVCGKNSFDADCVKNILERMSKDVNLVNVQFIVFINVFGENSLDGENLENFYHSCYEFLFEYDPEDKINNRLNSEISKKLFQKLCEFHKIEKAKKQNKKLGIFGIVGVTIGGLSGLVAIGLGAAIGVGALAVTIVAPIVSAVVGLTLLIFGICFMDKFNVGGELIKIKKAKLNGQSISKDEIRWDLRNRKKIKDALDVSKEPLLQNDESDRSQ